MAPEFEIHTSWTPADALALLDDHDGCVSAAIVRLGTIRTMELARLDRVIKARRAGCFFSGRRLDEVRRDTAIAIGQEIARRVMLLQDVARAHGLIGEPR